MTWGYVDDRLHSHPKSVDAKLEAMGLWVMALSYCCAYLTDGFVSFERLKILAGRRGDDLANKLCLSGLWHADNGGFRFHDWASWQKTKAQVIAEREAAKARMRGNRSASVRPNFDRTSSERRPEEGSATLGSGSDSEDPESKVVSVTARPSLVGSDIETLEDKIREHDVFDCLDARRIANSAAHRIQSTGKPKLAWALTAIDDCADKSDGLGLTAETLQAKLVGFIKAAKAPREETGKRAHEVERREEAWEREKHTAIAPAEVLKRVANMPGIGTGGRR